LTASLAALCLRVSQPAGEQASLRLLSLCERRTHWTLTGVRRIGRTLPLVLFLGLAEAPQPRVPVGQRVGDEAVARIHPHVSMTSAVSLVLGSLDVPVAQAIGLVEAGAYLPLNPECQLERHRCTASTSKRCHLGVESRCRPGRGTAGLWCPNPP
jgi:hypothetical protein